MSDKFESSLINLGELSKPATVLVEKISDAVGGIFKPYQLVRVAKAEAQADRVHAESQIEISDLQRRAFHRFLKEEANKQQNIEDITQKALPLLKENSKPDEVEDDWITNFFDRCRLISDDEMQQLWSRVLAGEANLPGTFSKRTVNLLSHLDKSDAELFTQLCGFGWMLDEFTPVVFDDTEPIYKDNGINFDTLSHLDAIGLVTFLPATEIVGSPLPLQFIATYYGLTLDLDLTVENGELLKGKVILTKAGLELATICESQRVTGFFEYCRNKWESEGFLGTQSSEVGPVK